jgi:hypothetical protein
MLKAGESPATWSTVLAELHSWFRDHLDAGPGIAEVLYQMAVAGELPSAEVEVYMYLFADEYELAANGVHGRREDVDAHLREFLSRFAA